MRKRFEHVTKKEILKYNSVDISTQPSLFYGIDYPHKHNTCVFDFETIFPLRKIKYEHQEYYGPNKPEKLLEEVFGDYMKLPDDCYPRHTSANISSKEIADEITKFINT